MNNLKIDRHYNRIVEIIENRKNREQHLDSLHNMVDTFYSTFKSKRKARKLRRLIHGEQSKLRMRTILFQFVERIEF